MNENNYIQTIGENSTLQDSIIENMYLKAFACPALRSAESAGTASARAHSLLWGQYNRLGRPAGFHAPVLQQGKPPSWCQSQ